MSACLCAQFALPLQSLSDVKDRCALSSMLSASFVNIATDSERWLAIYRCRECGMLWAKEYPFSERHGGGPTCFYQVFPDEPLEWLATAEPITPILRMQDEDLAFLT
jgi:hypothetical protein